MIAFINLNCKMPVVCKLLTRYVTLASVSGVARYMATVPLRLMFVSDVACNMATVRLRPMSACGYSISVMLSE